MDDIRWTDEEKDNIRQEFLTSFAIARRAQWIKDKQNVNPTFDTVEELMKLLMGLEEQAKEARDDVCHFLQHRLDRTSRWRRAYQRPKNFCGTSTTLTVHSQYIKAIATGSST